MNYLLLFDAYMTNKVAFTMKTFNTTLKKKKKGFTHCPSNSSIFLSNILLNIFLTSSCDLSFTTPSSINVPAILREEEVTHNDFELIFPFLHPPNQSHICGMIYKEFSKTCAAILCRCFSLSCFLCCRAVCLSKVLRIFVLFSSCSFR